MEVGLIIFRDGLVDDRIFNLAWVVSSLEELENQTFQEVLLLAKVLLILKL